jgi:DNA polymerase-1
MDAPTLFDADLGPPVPPGAAAVTAAAAGPARAGTRRSRPVLLAVDGNSLGHRAFHAYGAADIADGSGGDRGAVYGFFALLAGICDVSRASGLVVGFDCGESSRRRERWPQYKANRPDKDPALPALLDLVAAVLEHLEVTVARPEGWEADDVLGSAAAGAEAAGWDCVLATSDRDAFGLVSERTTVLRLRSGIANAERVTPERLRRQVGVEPHQYVEFAALRGDTSDNLPGVHGIGPARARALLREYATVAEAVADPLGCRSVLGPTAGQTLLDDLAAPESSVFLRNVGLMTMRRDLSVDVEACRPSCPPHTVEERLRDWGLQALAGRLTLAVALRPEAPPPPVL